MSTLHTYKSGIWESICAGTGLYVAKNGVFNQVKPRAGDLVWANSQWNEICPSTGIIYYGLADASVNNPTVFDSNINEIGLAPDDYVFDVRFVSIRLWFSTVDHYVSGGGETGGDGLSLAQNILLFINFSGSGDIPPTAVDWQIISSDIQGASPQIWTGNKNIAIRLNAGDNQNYLLFKVFLPVQDNYFTINIIPDTMTYPDYMQIVPIKTDAPTKDWGWSISDNNHGDGFWRTKRTV